MASRHGVRLGSTGAVSAEWALTLPAVMVALAVVLGGIGVGIDRGRLLQAAADGQRVLAYGGSVDEATSHIHQLLSSADPIITVEDGPAPHITCVRVTRPQHRVWSSVVGSDRTAVSCGLQVPR